MFYDPLVDVLGEMSDYKPGIGISMDEVIPKVVLAAGVNARGGRSRARKIRRNITFAMRNQRARTEGYPGRQRTVLIDRGVWGLLPEGVDHALRRRRLIEGSDTWRPLHQRNLTKEWFAEHGKTFLATVGRLAAEWGLPWDTQLRARMGLADLAESDGLRDMLLADELPDVLEFVGSLVDLPPRPSMPTPTEFYDAAIVALCKLTDYRSRRYIKASDVYDPAFRYAGIDQNTHPYIVTGMWSLHATSGLPRKVQHALRNQSDTREQTCSTCGEQVNDPQAVACPVCETELSPRYAANKMYTTLRRVSGKSGLRSVWALTSKGVARGLTIQCPDESALSEFWLRSVRTEVLVSLPARVKAHFRRLSSDRIADLTEGFLGMLRAENPFLETLLAGEPPSDRKLITACFQFVEEQASRSNATVAWFDVGTERKLDAIHKRLAGQLPKSRNIGEIEDLVHDYVSNAIRLNSIGRWMENHPGRRVTDRMVANWALRRAYSKFRDAAKCCHQREFRDARTKEEREVFEASRDNRFQGEAAQKCHEEVAKHSEGATCVPVHLTLSTEGKRDLFAGTPSASAPLVDVVDDTEMEARIIHHIDRGRGFTMLEDAVRLGKPGASERYVGIFKAVYEDDKTTHEIAEQEHVRRNRAASLTQDMRGALRANLLPPLSNEAKAIFKELLDEPFSTEDDLRTELGFDLSVVNTVLKELSSSGWLEARFLQAVGEDGEPKKIKGMKPGYSVSDTGRVLWDRTEVVGEMLRGGPAMRAARVEEDHE
jgi:hypothetical protein